MTLGSCREGRDRQVFEQNIDHLIHVKHLLESHRNRAIIRIAGHYLSHVHPPSTAHFRLGDSRPLRLVSRLCVAKELERFRMQKDGIIGDAVGLQDINQVRPYRRMPTSILGLKSRMDRHDECFSQHGLHFFP